MPFLLLAVILAVVLLTPKTVQGFERGEPITLTVASIGDFGCVLRTDAAAAWNSMKTDAAADGVILRPKGPNSAFRTHDQQVAMVTGAATAALAAQVDHSPHQMGIAVDVDLTQEGDPLSWMNGNAYAYGFFPLPGAGASKEPWHWEFHGQVQNA